MENQDKNLLDAIIDIIQPRVNKERGIKGLAEPDDRLDDLGIDSIDLIELNMEVEEKYGITIRDNETRTDMTINEYVSIIHKKNTH